MVSKRTVGTMVRSSVVRRIAIPIRIFLLLFLFRFDVAVFVIIFILFHHLTIFNNDNAVCHLGDGLVVGNHDQGLPILGNAVLED